MSKPMRNRARTAISFRPSLQHALLEERVVLSTVTLPQIEQAYTTQFKVALLDLRQQLKADVNALYANGRPTAQQRADFNAAVQGTVDATVLRLSSQYALLPATAKRLIPNMQKALIGTGSNSLVNRIETAMARPGNTASASALNASLTRQLNGAFVAENARLNNYFNTTSVRQLSVDNTGQRIGVQQFMAGQLVSQLGNSLGAISQSFPTLATSALFANGATTATGQNAATFFNQAAQALGTTAFQLGSSLSLFPNANTTIIPQLQSGLFGDGQPITLTGGVLGSGAPDGPLDPNTPIFSNFLSAFQGLPMTSDGFNTAASTAFNSGFQNLTTSLNGFTGLNSQPNVSLPTSPITGFNSTSFTNFGNGFNNGFGSGSLGFGTVPTDFNSNFGTGFNSAVSMVNPSFGFNVPTSAFNPPVTTFNPPIPGSGSTGPTGAGTGTGLPGF